MNNEDKGLILLYSPLSKSGHLDSWLELVIQSLVDSGYSVSYLAENKINTSSIGLDKVNFIPFRKIDKRTSSISKFLLFEWCALGRKYELKLPGYLPSNQSGVLKKIQKYIFRKLVPTLYKLTLFFPLIKKASSIDLNFDQFISRVNASEKLLLKKPSLVINLYLDFYSNSFDLWKYPLKKIRWPWAGIRFTPDLNEDSDFLSLESFKGQWILDETLITDFQIKWPNKKIEFLPDFADNRLPAMKISKIVDVALNRATGRKIIFLGGSISRRKNISYWLNLMEVMNPEEWFFIMIGRVYWGDLPREDVQKLRLAEVEKENFYMVDAYINDEAELNEFISISNLIFAVYKEFPFSSNMLSKAAEFEKPIVTSQNHLMGRLVEKYKIGLTVSEENYLDAVRKIEKLEDCEFKYKDFSAKYSRENFQQALVKMTEEIIQNER